MHWFKHARLIDLQNVKIYDFVCDELARGFRSSLRIFLADESAYESAGAFLAYRASAYGALKVWV